MQESKPELNPKERFMKEFKALLDKFEEETGTEVFNISLKRVNVSRLNGLMGAKTAIAEILFDFH